MTIIYNDWNIILTKGGNLLHLKRAIGVEDLESNSWGGDLERSLDIWTSKTESKGGLCSETPSDLEIDPCSVQLQQLWGPWAASPPNAGVYRYLKHSKKGAVRLLLTWGLHETKLALVALPSPANSGDACLAVLPRFLGAVVVLNSLDF